MNRPEFEKLIDKVREREDFLKWNKGNKISPYRFTENESDIFMVFHGTFSDQVINKIDPSRSSNSVFAQKGMYFSTSVDEVSEYYTNLNNENADVHFSLSELYEDPESLIRRFNLEELLPELDIESVESSEDVILHCIEVMDDDIYESVFKYPKNTNLDDFDYKEIIKNAYIRNSGVIYPAFIKMENPCYMIEPINASNKGLKSTVIRMPLFDVYDEPILIDEVRSNSLMDFNKLLREINITKDEEKELLESLNSIGVVDQEIICDYIENYLEFIDYEFDGDDSIWDKLDLIFEEDLYYFGDISEIAIQENNYLKIKGELENNATYLNLNEIIFDNDIVNEDREINLYELFRLFKSSEISIEGTDVLSEALFTVYDGFIYDAENDFQYVKDNCFEGGDSVFHFIARGGSNVKYAFNETFSSTDEMMYKKMIDERKGQNISIDSIRKIEKRFKKKYPDFPEIKIHDYSCDTVAYLNKSENYIGLYKNNIKKESELIKAIYHEYIIHGGIKKYLDEKKDKGFLLEVYNAFKGREDFKKIKDTYIGSGKTTLKDKELVAEEFVAYCAENKLYKKDKLVAGFIERLSLMVSKFKEKFNIETPKDKVSILIHDIEKEKRSYKSSPSMFSRARYS